MPADPLPPVDFDAFARLDIRTAVVLGAAPFPEARRPAVKLDLDFGPPIGRRTSSAQLTSHYRADQLVGSEVVAVVNFAPRRIAGFKSEVLVLGMVNPDSPGEVVLIRPDRPGTQGWRLG